MTFIQRLLSGRYGWDQLNFCLTGTALVLYLLDLALDLSVLYVLYLLCIVAALYRMLSRNYARRRGKHQIPHGGRSGHPLVQAPAHHPPGQGAPVFQVPQLRSAAPGPPGQGQGHHHLPQLRGILRRKDIKKSCTP